MNRATDADLQTYRPCITSYPSSGQELSGVFLLPDSDERVPGIVFNHGSLGLLPANKTGAVALCQMGYAVFLPVRRGHNGNPGTYWLDRVTEPWGSGAMGDQLVAALQDESLDVIAALEWIARQPQVDPYRLVIVGSSFGGVVSIFAAAKVTVRAAISFAGPSMSWPDAPALQHAMLEAVQHLTCPLFLIQACNDHSLAPTYTLGSELARLGKPHETRVYGVIGTEPIHGHGIFSNSVALWRADVERFLQAWMR